MSGVFIDTSGWANLFVKTEPYHERAVKLIHDVQAARRRIVTSNYVIAELSALLMSPLRVAREPRLNLLGLLRAAKWVDILHVDPALDAASWAYLFSRSDKDFSLVDCSSFAIMRQQGLSESLTADIHFEQAGFIRLLK